MIEFNSIARGIYTADQMVKTSNVDIVTANTVCPGKYISIVHGDVSAVENSVRMGVKVAGEYLVDQIVIPNVHSGVFPAIVSANVPDEIRSYSLTRNSYFLPCLLFLLYSCLKRHAVPKISFSAESFLSVTSLTSLLMLSHSCHT